MSDQKQAACDIWSIGTLVYMLLSGRPPFYGSTTEVLKRIRRAHFHFGHEFDMISRETKEAIERMLTRKGEQRPNFAEMLRHPFAQMQVTTKKKGVICHDALAKLEVFAKETHCRQTVARMLADLGLQDAQYADLEERFKDLDLDGNGVIEVNELCEVAAAMTESKDYEAITKTITEIVKHCDRNDNATVDISEFIAAVVLELEGKNERLLVKAFEKMDMNRDARITKGELFRVLRQYSDSLVPEDVGTFVRDMDKDADQKIDFNEFKYLFPHMKERDDEIKASIRSVAAYREKQRKDYQMLLQDSEHFLKGLRTAAGNLAGEYQKLIKMGDNERDIVKKLDELARVVKDFAGFPEEQAEEKRLTQMAMTYTAPLTGVAVMAKYNGIMVHDHELERQKEALLKKLPAEMVNRSPSPSPRSLMATDDEIKSTRARSPFSKRRLSREMEAAMEHSKGQMPTVSEFYMAKGGYPFNKERSVVKKEANRRRRYAWLGGGDGLEHCMDFFQHKKAEVNVLLKARDHDHRRHYKTVEELEEADEIGEDAVDEKHLLKEWMKGDRTEEEQDEMEDLKDIIPWVTGGRRLKLTKEAMKLAAGPMMMTLGSIHDEDILERRIARCGDELCREYAIPNHTTPDLSDINHLLRFKVLRSWLPRIILWRKQLVHSWDENRVHMHQRRNLHIECIKHVLQTVEKIIFSLLNFICFQGEAFEGLWAAEECARQPPVSRRFLPFRGDVDEDARTPRDEDDAAALAPEWSERRPEGPASGSERELSAQRSAHSDGLVDASSQGPGTRSGMMESGMSTRNGTMADATSDVLGTGLRNLRRLDRSFVRSRKSRDLKTEQRIVELAAKEMRIMQMHQQQQQRLDELQQQQQQQLESAQLLDA
eukprot:TRINITY_DN7787_c0_g1_i2.p1 TRINITY_DN7787_c0_g1~~TRINITY_DN7787_c0_g1_i2.p1  ORF type:complete len:883 (-),score=237.24 TRINITY_DN7787_c0_g1_i2:105-2753(-)